MFKKTGIILAALVVLLLGAVALRPSKFTVTRMAEVSAPPALVFAEVNDFAAWKAWSPWEALDPAMQHTYSANTAGVGASFEWKGNDKAGEGKMTITESTPGEKVGIDLEFREPWPGKHRVELAFAKMGEGTRVTWTMTGQNGFVEKLFGLVISMDQVVGHDFDTGLASLKAVAESKAQAATPPPAPEPTSPEATDGGTAEAMDAGVAAPADADAGAPAAP